MSEQVAIHPELQALVNDGKVSLSEARKLTHLSMDVDRKFQQYQAAMFLPGKRGRETESRIAVEMGEASERYNRMANRLRVWHDSEEVPDGVHPC